MIVFTITATGSQVPPSEDVQSPETYAGYAGTFADQSHFTKVFQRQVGVTETMAARPKNHWSDGRGDWEVHPQIRVVILPKRPAL